MQQRHSQWQQQQQQQWTLDVSAAFTDRSIGIIRLWLWRPKAKQWAARGPHCQAQAGFSRCCY
jgi:hypothetical protein